MNQFDKKEIKFLKGVMRKVESSKTSIVLRAWFNPLLWVVCAVALLIAFQWHGQTKNPVILVVVSALVGIVAGVVSILQSGERSWPYIKRHLDIESIKRVLDGENT